MKNVERVSLNQMMQDIPLADIIKNNILSEISTQLIMKRMDSGMNQEEFAKSMGISQSMLSKYENGTENLTAKTIAEILSKLNVTADLLCKPRATVYDSITTRPVVAEPTAVYAFQGAWASSF